MIWCDRSLSPLVTDGHKEVRTARSSGRFSDGAPRQLYGFPTEGGMVFWEMPARRARQAEVQVGANEESRSRSAGRAAVRFAVAAAAKWGCKGATARVRCEGAAGGPVTSCVFE
jgi:hypothetical protein